MLACLRIIVGLADILESRRPHPQHVASSEVVLDQNSWLAPCLSSLVLVFVYPRGQYFEDFREEFEVFLGDYFDTFS